MKILALMVLPALALASCSTPEQIVTQYRCPTLQRYSQDQQKRALAELQSVEGQIPTIKEMANDYNRLRKACGAMEHTASPTPWINAVFPH